MSCDVSMEKLLSAYKERNTLFKEYLSVTEGMLTALEGDQELEPFFDKRTGIIKQVDKLSEDLAKLTAELSVSDVDKSELAAIDAETKGVMERCKSIDGEIRAILEKQKAETGAAIKTVQSQKTVAGYGKY